MTDVDQLIDFLANHRVSVGGWFFTCTRSGHGHITCINRSTHRCLYCLQDCPGLYTHVRSVRALQAIRPAKTRSPWEDDND